MSDMRSPEKMDLIARSTFRDVYPAIAGQIRSWSGISEGICVDIGAGPASLAIAMAKISDLSLYTLDISHETNMIAKRNIEAENMAGRIIQVRGDVHRMPFRDHMADLVISRGSMFFWSDRVKAFSEVRRILKAGGCAYVGGGLGDPRSRKPVAEKLPGDTPSDNGWHRNKISADELRSDLYKADIGGYELIDDISGLWVII
jgi:ubiquinone/menaquinone biosynthesis C-methylase UbiE